MADTDVDAPARTRPRFRLTAWEASEFEIQCSLAGALRKFCTPDTLWLHIPNGEARDAIVGAKLKRMGLRAGAADLLFVLPGAPALFLEIKTRSGWQSTPQRAFEAQAVTAGCEYRICRSLDEALALLWSAGFLARKLC